MLSKLKESGFERVSFREAEDLAHSTDIIGLGSRADKMRRALHGAKTYYAINAALTYSNTCEALCPICSFARREKDPEAYVLTPQDAYERARRFVEAGADEIHIIGGMYSKLPFEYYVDFIRNVRKAGEKLTIVAFTVSECVLMSRVSGRPLKEVIKILMDAGVDALPGGGAEIFDSSVRMKISPNKLSAEEWLGAMRTAHECGLKTNATMLFGHIESPENVVDHLMRLRALQDETGGFKAFVPLPFRKGKSSINANSSGVYALKICALARIILDNFEHVRTPASHYADRFEELMLYFGADDLGGTYWSEEVAVSAGAKKVLRTENDLRQTIARAGFEPVRTNSNYDL